MLSTAYQRGSNDQKRARSLQAAMLLYPSAGFDSQKAYFGPRTAELISPDIPLVFKRPITKTYKALRVTKRQTSIRAWPPCVLRTHS